MLREEDKIFKNLYGFEDWSLSGAKKRGIWSNTKEIIEKGSDFIVEEIKVVNYEEEAVQAFLLD